LIPHIAHSNDIFAFAQRKLNELWGCVQG
jgi:hypothetical protein